MNFYDDLPVPAMGLADIDQTMAIVRQRCQLAFDDCVDIEKVLAALGIRLEPRPDAEMARGEALAAPKAKRIFVRRSVTQALRVQCRVTRAKLSHEIGHVVLHDGPALKPLVIGGNKSSWKIPEDQSSERQAWQAGRSLMLPREASYWSLSDSHIAGSMHVPEVFVHERRLEIARLDALNQPKKDISALVEQAMRVLQPPARPQYGAKSLRCRRDLWDGLPVVEGYEPDQYRLATGYLVKWDDYMQPNPPSHTGWKIKDGQIVPLFADE